MLEQTPKREAGTNWASSAFENKDRRRMFIALLLLLASLAVVLVKNREIWFAADETSATDDSPVWNPNSVVPATPVPAAKAQKQVAAKVPAKPANKERAVVASSHVLPPLEVAVVGGDTRSNSVKVTMPPDSGSRASGSTAVEWGPATNAAERVQMASDKAPAVPRSVELPYPLLARQMKVQGSVLLQALINADGVVRDLRVLSGPAILASAAREAARGWRFRPYLQNGQPVETQATIAVNFTINVLNNGTREQMTLARGGE
jgi:periplasmic protein TonB